MLSLDAGGLFGEIFIVKQIIPLLRSIADSCVCTSFAQKAEPMQSWVSAALMDCLTALDGLIPLLTNETMIKELIEVALVLNMYVHCRLRQYSKHSFLLCIQNGNCPYVMILMNKGIGVHVLQVLLLGFSPQCDLILQQSYQITS